MAQSSCIHSQALTITVHVNILSDCMVPTHHNNPSLWIWFLMVSDDIVLLISPLPPPADPPVHHRQKTMVTDMCYPTEISSLMDFGTPDCSLGKGTGITQEGEKKETRTKCCHGDNRRCAQWFTEAVKRHAAVRPTGRSTPEQRPVWRPWVRKQSDNSSQYEEAHNAVPPFICRS